MSLDKKERNRQYLEYINAKEPKTENYPSLLIAFLIGGTICLLGEGIVSLLLFIWPMMSITHAYVWMQIVLIFLAILLTGIGVFDDIGRIAGAGTFIPITGFANSVASPAMEFRREGIIFGLCVKMFVVAGPVIVSAIVSSVVVGIIYIFL